MKKALVIGINDYNAQSLSYCAHDAQEFLELIKRNEDETVNFDAQSFIGAGYKGILYHSIEQLFNCEDELALLYFSGHGADKNNGYLCTTDGTSAEPGIRLEDVLRLANESRCKNRVIILDCCFAGQIGEVSNFGNCSHLSNGLTIIAACKNNQHAEERFDLQHGVFTKLLLEGLRGGAADITGNITPASIYAFIDQSLGAWQQRPVFKTNTSKFIPLRNVNPRVSNSILRHLTEYFTTPDNHYQLDPSYEYTNSPKYQQCKKEPYAKEENVKIFKELQLLTSVGLIEPIGVSHMYFAAMENHSCRLTKLGQHYWRLAKDGRI